MKSKEQCFICKSNALIAEEHYIVPNCHTYLHLILNKKFEKFSDVFDYFKTQQMKKALIKIYNRYYYLKAKNERCKNAN